MTGRTRTSPTMPSASARLFSGTRSDTCQRIAADCMRLPENEIRSPIQSRRKLRWRSAANKSPIRLPSIWAMPTSLGRIEPVARSQGSRLAEGDPPSPDVLRDLHRTYVRGRRRTFLMAAPFGVLAGLVLISAAPYPEVFGALVFPAVVSLAAVGRIGYEWLTLRRADPVTLYLREQRDA